MQALDSKTKAYAKYQKEEIAGFIIAVQERIPYLQAFPDSKKSQCRPLL